MYAQKKKKRQSYLSKVPGMQDDMASSVLEICIMYYPSMGGYGNV